MSNHNEQSPLLQRSASGEHDAEEPETIEFSKEDDDNPRAWSRSKKLTNIAVVAMMASEYSFRNGPASIC